MECHDSVHLIENYIMECFVLTLPRPKCMFLCWTVRKVTSVRESHLTTKSPLTKVCGLDSDLLVASAAAAAAVVVVVVVGGAGLMVGTVGRGPAGETLVLPTSIIVGFSV